MAQLKCTHLTLGYEGHPVLSDLSFEVGEGDWLCIVGENGAGKSTLMKTILGLIRPLSGSVEWGEGMKQTEIGYLPQQTEVQKVFPATVREIVLSGCQNRLGARPFYRREDRERARRAMERFQISDLGGRSYRSLSGGQQQRVLLARALCATRKLLLLDETVSGLDPRATREMYAAIQSLHAQGITVIMISHDLVPAVHHATHVLHVGHHVFFGPRDAYAQSEEGRYFLSMEGEVHAG